MNGKSARAVSVAVIAVMVLSVIPFALSDGSDAAVTIRDGYGNEFTFDSEPEHVITVGRGITATVIQIEALDKIVVCDSYSANDDSDVFSALKTKVAEGEIVASGNIYTSGKTDLINSIVNAADTEKGGKFDKSKDPVFITGGNTYIDPIKEDLESKGFSKVLVWNDITDYSEIATFVSTVSQIVNGSESDKVEQMKHVSEVIADGVKDKTPRDAFYVTHSGGVYKVGNTNSLANSMITAAGGKSVTTDDGKAKPTYEASLTALIEAHPDAVIFIDNSINKDAELKATLLSRVGRADGKDVVPLDPLWNNYSIESMTGVWTMACAMYPDTFEGDVPTVDVEKKNNPFLYIGIGSAAAVVIIVVGLMFMRKR